MAEGTQGLQAVNTMEFIVRAVRAFAVPLVVPVPRSWQAFDGEGRPAEEGLEDQLRRLGREVVRATRQMVATGHLRLRGGFADTAQSAPVTTRPSPGRDN